jgi:glycosyltransferase involved in cell wall biosynthesis
MLAEQDIFATHTEHWEISKAVLEALLTGLPVLLNRRLGMPVPELERLCMFVDDTVDGYHGGLRALTKDDGMRERLGRQGRAEAEARWSPDQAEAHYAQIYTGLLAQAPSIRSAA